MKKFLRNHLKFSNWFFERKYLGYSHSVKIKDVFGNSNDLYDSLELKSTPDNDRVKYVGVVTDSISRTSGAGN